MRDIEYGVERMCDGLWSMEYVVWRLQLGVWSRQCGIWVLEYVLWNMDYGAGSMVFESHNLRIPQSQNLGIPGI